MTKKYEVYQRPVGTDSVPKLVRTSEAAAKEDVKLLYFITGNLHIYYEVRK